jgi:hypothetical protein
MRVSPLRVAIALTSWVLVGAVPAADEPGVRIFSPQQAQPGWLKHKRLDDDEALQRLQSANPRHYAIARRILAAANEICDAQRGAPLRMKFAADNVSCVSGMWLTSNPPKRELNFWIDDTVYSALVEVRDTGAKLVPADPAWSQNFSPRLRK